MAQGDVQAIVGVDLPAARHALRPMQNTSSAQQRDSPTSVRRRFARDGFAIIDTGLLKLRVGTDSCAQPARRMLDAPWCQTLARQLACDPMVAATLPDSAVAVQCTWFEKSMGRNWLVPIHQDLMIPVRERINNHPRLHGWSVKDGLPYVQAPASTLRQVVAVRLHLDACEAHDGALCVVPGSHLHGVIDNVEAAAQRAPEVMCPVPKGHAMIMRPLLLHRSGKASGASRRRVLHFVFGPAQLPHGLSWSAAAIRLS